MAGENERGYEQYYDDFRVGDDSYYGDRANFEESRRELEDRNRARQAREDADRFAPRTTRSAVYPDIGRIVVPIKGPEAPYLEYHAILTGINYNVDFDTEQYRSFDGVLADELAKDRRFKGLTDPQNRDYAKFEDLRDNIALVRSAILAQYFPDEKFSPNSKVDIEKRNKLEDMGRRLGKNLRYAGIQDKWRSNLSLGLIPLGRALGIITPFPAHNIDGMGEKHVGAQTMYRTLLSIQQQPFKKWNLPDLDHSPFRDIAIKTALRAQMRGELPEGPEAAKMLRTRAIVIEQMAAELGDVDNLEIRLQRDSIKLGHEILEKLKVEADKDASRSTSQQRPYTDAAVRSSEIEKLADIYQTAIAFRAQNDPAYRSSDDMQLDREMLGKLGHFVMLESQQLFNRMGDGNALEEMRVAIDKLPPSYTTVQDMRMEDVYQHISRFLEDMNDRITGQPLSTIEISPDAKSLLENTARRLHGAEITASSKNVVAMATEIANQARREAKAEVREDRAARRRATRDEPEAIDGQGFRQR